MSCSSLMSLQRGCRAVSASSYGHCVLRGRRYQLVFRRICAQAERSSPRAGYLFFPSSSLPRFRSSVSLAHGRYLSTCSTLYSVDDVHKDAAASSAGTISVDATAGNTTATYTTSLDNVTPFESSASMKWAADALTELPPQSDLASLGLCANTPVGWLQYMLEYIHVHAGLPWWGAIVVSTLVLRAVIFPVVMKVQKNGVIMNNINPEIQKLMKKQREYRQMGNRTLSDRYSHKIWNVYKQHKCNPLKMAVMPLIQLPLFISFFIAIRKMAAVPVESLKTGGILWFEDLTTSDPYYILPVLACGSFVASIELGGETGVGNPQTARLKNVFRLMPVILIPITASFPTGLFMYWLPASFVSIAQILLLKVERVRSLFGIPQMVHHPPDPQEQNKGVVGYFKENYNTSAAIAEAKQKKRDAMKRYNQLKKNPRPKLFDEPPHLIKDTK